MYSGICVSKLVFIYPKWIRKFELREYSRKLDFEWETATEKNIKRLRNDVQASLDFLGIVPPSEISGFRAVAHFQDEENIYFQRLNYKKRHVYENFSENIPDRYFSMRLEDFNQLQKKGEIKLEQVIFLDEENSF